MAIRGAERSRVGNVVVRRGGAGAGGGGRATGGGENGLGRGLANSWHSIAGQGDSGRDGERRDEGHGLPRYPLPPTV